MGDDPFDDEIWGSVRLRTLSKDGHPSETLHSHRGEIEGLKDDILDRLDEVDRKTSEYIFDEEEHREPEHPESHDISILPRDLSHQIVALFALSTGIMEEQTDMILRNSVFAKDMQNSNIIDDMVDQTLNQKLQWVDELPKSDPIDLSAAHDVRQTRNVLLHNPRERLRIKDLDDFKGSVKKAFRAPEELDKIY